MSISKLIEMYVYTLGRRHSHTRPPPIFLPGLTYGDRMRTNDIHIGIRASFMFADAIILLPGALEHVAQKANEALPRSIGT